MAITERSILLAGTRVEVTRGRFPADPVLVGRTGTVVESSPYLAYKVDVQLDGEPTIRTFAPEELVVVSAPEVVPSDHAAAKKRLSRP